MWPYWPPFPGDPAHQGNKVADSVTFNSFALASDGAGGAVVAWKQRRNGLYDVYVQHPRPPDGYNEWFNGALPLATGTTSALPPELVTGPNGGVIASWDDNRNGPFDVYAAQVVAPVLPTAAGSWELYD